MVYTFFIRRNGNKFDITCSKMNLYNRYGLDSYQLYYAMNDIQSIFYDDDEIEICFKTV